MNATPGAVAPPGPSDRLREQLVRPLRGPLVGEVQRDVGGHDADQRDLGHVEALGHEAGPDQDVEPARRERVEHPVGGALALDDVAVQAADPQRPGTARAPRAPRAPCRRRGTGSAGEAQAGQRDAGGQARPQWWQRSEVPARW